MRKRISLVFPVAFILLPALLFGLITLKQFPERPLCLPFFTLHILKLDPFCGKTNPSINPCVVGQSLIRFLYLTVQHIVVNDQVIPSPVRFPARKCNLFLFFKRIHPIRHINPPEFFDQIFILQFFRRKNSPSQHFSISGFAILLRFGKRDDIFRTPFFADAAV